MIVEVRRQFREIPGLKGAEGIRPSTPSASRSRRRLRSADDASGLLAVTAPVVAGFFSVKVLGGLAEALVSGVLLAIFMSNAGGAGTTPSRSKAKKRARQ